MSITSNKSKKRVLSGIRPTNRLHIGNYLGAVKGMLELQNSNDYETFYMVADLHAITTPYSVEELSKTRIEVVMDYLACGLDPKRSTIFLQSSVPQHTELSYYLSSVVTIARLQHLPTFKEKVKQYPEHSTMALLNYPVLMAADILVYKSNAVPVGLDQMPHLEVAREIARKMNDTYETEFPVPEVFKSKGEYVPSLTGEGKMSKSVEGSYVNLADTKESIRAKVAKIPTDSGKGTKEDLAGSVATFMKFVELFQGSEKRREYEALYLSEGLAYKDLKDQLAEAIYSDLAPIQEKRQTLVKDQAYVRDVIEAGETRAREVAQQTLHEVREKMGFSS